MCGRTAWSLMVIYTGSSAQADQSCSATASRGTATQSSKSRRDPQKILTPAHREFEIVRDGSADAVGGENRRFGAAGELPKAAGRVRGFLGE
ncbi:hypothetical protein P692DRAFT_20475654 [Suillus brevipes Sb2]|nr:hypothetical protein P692DRAFT_20475654 [Suillus brevipes Sb2]